MVDLALVAMFFGFGLVILLAGFGLGWFAAESVRAIDECKGR